LLSRLSIVLFFRDLQKLVSQQQRQRTVKELFARLKDKPFWVWEKEQHRLEAMKAGGDCCFNHIIGLPQKNAIEKPLFDYEQIIFDALSTNKHLWTWHVRAYAQVHGLALLEG
jgi:hypothetical protein